MTEKLQKNSKILDAFGIPVNSNGSQTLGES